MIEIKANRSPWTDDIELLVIERTGLISDRKYSVAINMIMSSKKVGEITEPTMRLKTTQAQELMDNLWHCGLRPSEGTGSAGALAATQKHLEDMRKIAFDAFTKITDI